MLLGLRDGLRSGDVYVPSSRRYADPASYLFTSAQWEEQREQFCQLVGKPTDARVALEGCKEELAAAMGDLEKALGNAKAGTGQVRLSPGGELIIPPLSAEDIPAEAADLKEELSELLPLAPIASLLVELDRRTGFLDCFTHAGGKQARSPELKRNLLAVLIANATNLGLVRMAEACGISYDILAWTQEWYIREETLAAANAAVVNYHHRLPLTQAFGGGTLSSSVGKLSASSRQNTLAAALKEYGALRRTIYAARYLADETYRRKIARQLNKGESLHSLRRSLLYAHEGAIRHRHLAAQTEQAWCLTLLTNSVVTWTTEYYGQAIAQMRAEGRAVDDELLAHISPAHSENVNFFGTINVEVDTELAKLDPAGYRPLRPRRPDRS